MSNIINLECRLKGHRTACIQEATLLADGGGRLEHWHTCLRCQHRERFPDTDLDPTLEGMLRMAVRPGNQNITIGLSEPHTHRLN